MKNKLHLTGLSNVFSFTLRQLLKTKANLVMLLILIVLSLASVPVYTLLFGGSVEKEPDSHERYAVFLENRTQLDLSGISEAAEKTSYTILTSNRPYTESNASASMRFLLTEEDGIYTLQAEVGDDPGAETDWQSAAMELSNVIQTCRLRSLGISDEMILALNKDVSVSFGASDETETEDFENLFLLQLVYSIVIMMISIISASFLIRSVIEEKVSKLVETMTICVEPLAMIFGKILAVLAFTLIELGSVILSVTASYLITGFFTDTGAVKALIQNGILSAFQGIHPAHLVMILVTVLLGCLSFALISSLSGVGCSTMEDAGTANSLSMLLALLGYMISILTSSIGTPPAAINLIPFLSLFTAPVQYILGHIGFGTVFAAWVIQAAVAAALMIVCARVYRDLLFYNGSRLPFRRILSMAFQRKGQMK